MERGPARKGLGLEIETGQGLRVLLVRLCSNKTEERHAEGCEAQGGAALASGAGDGAAERCGSGR